MTLTILGSGTGVPSLQRSSPSYLLAFDDHRYLIDCGSGALRQLIHAGESYKRLDGVFVTHTHPDHIGDLVPLIHALKATPDFRRQAPLRLYGPPTFRDFYQNCVATVATPPKHFEVLVEELNESFEIDGLHITTCATLHSDQLRSVAYRFEHSSRVFVLSGDCDYHMEIIELARDADVLIIDCSFPDALKVGGHLSAGECGRIAAQAKVRELVLSHLYPIAPEQDTRLDEARAACRAEVRLAEDLMTVI